jgi:hypothetical protein
MIPTGRSIKKGAGNITRRSFISVCAACGACMAVSPLAFGRSSFSSPEKKKMKIRIIYSLHAPVQSQPDWPNMGFNFQPVMENINNTLKQKFPFFEFISTMATGPEDAEKILAEDKDKGIGGYIVYQMNCWNRVVQTIAGSEKPVLYVDFKYGGSGGFLTYTAAFLRNNQPNVGFVSSSRMEDLLAAVSCFESVANGGTANEFAKAVAHERLRSTPGTGDLSWKADKLKTLSADECLRRMKASKILAIRDQQASIAEPVMGIPLEYLTFAEVNQAWEKADKAEAKAVAEKWQKNARKMIDVSEEELQNSAAFYLGMKSVLKEHHANAITINCLGGFYGNHIHAYPCMGFHELSNEGLVGACECDIPSTATMLAFTTLTQGRPGYISDPVIDTSKRQIIYAHCVASNKMFGAEGPANPFDIMTHSEDRQGASVRSLLPTGYLTTTLKIDNTRKEIILHQAKAVDNDPDDRACRTKLCAEPVGDIEKLFREWDRWGWHRVTFYGDLKEPVYELAETMGWKVIEEA